MEIYVDKIQFVLDFRSHSDSSWKFPVVKYKQPETEMKDLFV